MDRLTGESSLCSVGNGSHDSLLIGFVSSSTNSVGLILLVEEEEWCNLSRGLVNLCFSEAPSTPFGLGDELDRSRTRTDLL